MSACSKYLNRFKTALAFRKLPFPVEIINYMGKRATADRPLDRILLDVCNIIEPPYCQKTHCPSHTTYSFCGCSKNLVPGRCKLNLEYLKRKAEREEKTLVKRLEQIPEKHFPISEHDKGRISVMTNYDWNKFLSKLCK